MASDRGLIPSPERWNREFRLRGFRWLLLHSCRFAPNLLLPCCLFLLPCFASNVACGLCCLGLRDIPAARAAGENLWFRTRLLPVRVEKAIRAPAELRIRTWKAGVVESLPDLTHGQPAVASGSELGNDASQHSRLKVPSCFAKLESANDGSQLRSYQFIAESPVLQVGDG